MPKSQSWMEPRTYSVAVSLRPWLRETYHESRSWRLERTNSRHRAWDESRSWALGLGESTK